MTTIPDSLRYTQDHEWVLSVEENRWRIGITDFAQSALGDVVYVNLPELGATVERGSAMGELESSKSVSDLLAPAPGRVVERNERLISTPSLVNTDPYGDGWICVVIGEGPITLMSADDYRRFVQ